MLPESWQTVEQLLLLCASTGQSELVALDAVLQVIQQSLPATCITLLLIEPSTYRYATVSTNLNDWIQQTIAISYDRDMTFIEHIQGQSYDAAIVFTAPGQSPYALAYYCYLAGIPLRLGQSQEFGGGVLSHAVQPPIAATTLTGYYLHLLKSIGFSLAESAMIAIG
ncbi:glycosyltransferase family 9 protein [Pantanalinema sp. GBBB05]|uniref:glycosyltransferase family 9 protein n=1 Tax=Pantanalinema sp. GBBB05 TaxID=2604139 RepID=UPI001DEA1582|nr:hypothetical protein [Pantanalinema sp. GBBB05]